jgi:sec-independent protein translocase protein TatC
MPTDQALFDEERSMVTMSFGDHIEDLRRHLIRALLGLFAGVVVTLLPPLNLGRLVVQQLQEPAQRTLIAFHVRHATERTVAADLAVSYTSIPARLPAQALARAIREVFPDLPAPRSESLEGRYIELPQELRISNLIAAVAPNLERTDGLIALGPMEPAVIFFKVCLVTGLVLSSPWAFYQAWAFVAAGLYRRERMFVYRFLPYSLGLFLAGVFICYFAVLPLTLRFLLEFNAWLGVTPMLRLTEWISFATVLPLIFGLCFQTPLVMLFMSVIGIFSAGDYRAKRRLAVLIIVVVAAILTPGPDVSAMLFLSIPMLLLYELGIFLAGHWGPAPTL